MARAKFSRAHLRARQVCAQCLVLEKMVKNKIFEALIMARSARAGMRARQKKFQIRKLQLK